MFGVYTRIRRISKSFAEFCLTVYFNELIGDRSFVFNNKKYKYFIHSYNYTWRNERIVEIPIVKRILDEYQDKDVLEVGNVLAHYFTISHDVLDKYEVSDGVINKDVDGVQLEKKYDLIIAISTLEHVGWDEKVRDLKKVLRGVESLKGHLNKGGKIIVTHPLGYNKYMDEYIENGELKFSEIYLMHRISEDNRWKQIPFKKNLYFRYHFPFPYANGLVVGIIKR